MNWQTDYERRFVTAEDAVKHVRSGHRVVFTTGREPQQLGLALAARREELSGVRIHVHTPGHDFGWYDEGWEDAFEVTVGYVFPQGVGREALDAKRVNQNVWSIYMGAVELEPIDVLLTEVSPPDKHGYCSFGASVWNKAEQIASSRLVIAEVNQRLIRTYGDNQVHYSEIDYFVEHVSSGRKPGGRDLLGRDPTPTEEQIQIARHLASLIRDRDTIQIGVGRGTEPLPRLGFLDDKNDLGWHSEVTPPGIIDLVRRGIMTGRRKTLDRGKAVACAIGGGTPEDMAYVDMNPKFELRTQLYVNDPRVIAAQDNQVAINNAIAVDLTGQIASESIGPRMWSGAGGQPPFAMGAFLAKNGRSITVLPSTAQGGKASRIVVQHPAGTVITVPRTVADVVVTEFGIARLRGAGVRQRAEQLIAIAHPDFRDRLREEARRLYHQRI